MRIGGNGEGVKASETEARRGIMLSVRTDFTLICRPCRLRVRATHQSCPECGGKDLVEGREWLRLRSRWSRRSEKSPTWTWYRDQKRKGTRLWKRPFLGVSEMILVFVVVCSLGEAGYFGDFDDLMEGYGSLVAVGAIAYFLAAPIFIPVFIWVALGLGLTFEWLGRKWRRMLGGKQPHTLRLESLVPEHQGVVTPGRVAIAESQALISPLSGSACVAFRLRGKVAGDEVDDSAAAAFNLVTEDDERVRIDAPPAFVDLTAGEPEEREDAVSQDLSGFLTRRGMFTNRGAITLAEACLAEGDLVEVQGAIFEETDASGAGADYRQAPMVRVIRETPEQPLVIRKV